MVSKLLKSDSPASFVLRDLLLTQLCSPRFFLSARDPACRAMTVSLLEALTHYAHRAATRCIDDAEAKGGSAKWDDASYADAVGGVNPKELVPPMLEQLVKQILSEGALAMVTKPPKGKGAKALRARALRSHGLEMFDICITYVLQVDIRQNGLL